MAVYRRSDHSLSSFLRRTVAAQIHALTLALLCGGAAVLLPKALAAGPDHFWSCFLFLLTGAMVFLTSATYHFLHDGYDISRRLQAFLENFDHYCIYLFIAGTYTPLLMNAVESPWREYLLIAAWMIAFSGIVYTRIRPHLFFTLQSRAVYTSLFVFMGFLFIVRVSEIWTRLSLSQVCLLAGGILAYLLGAIIYATRRPVLLKGVFGYHELWHLMVTLGAMLHFFFVDSFY